MNERQFLAAIDRLRTGSAAHQQAETERLRHILTWAMREPVKTPKDDYAMAGPA